MGLTYVSLRYWPADRADVVFAHAQSANIQRPTNRKSYMVYRTASF